MKSSTTSSRQGIALVIVVGLLFVMTILAVSFVITARTERIVSRSYADAVRARELCQTGITRALSDLDLSAVNSRWAYPMIGAFTSTTGLPLTARENAAMSAAFVYVPSACLSTAQTALAQATWTIVTNLPTPTSTNYLRYAYVAVDCSGFVDINNATNLGLTSIGISDALRNNLTNRVETVPDITAAYGAAFPSTYTYIHSRSTGGGGDTNTMIGYVPAWIGGKPANLNNATNKAAITAALTSIGFSATQITQLFNNLIDYTDTDDAPGAGVSASLGTNCNSICTEAVPMINEVVVRNRITDGGATKQNVVEVEVELWYPFVGRTNVTATTVRLNAALSGGTYTPTTFVATNSVAGTWTFNTYRTTKFTWTTSSASNATPPTQLLLNSIHVVQGSYVVDRVAFTNAWNTHLASQVADNQLESVWQADDPRINWLESHYKKNMRGNPGVSSTLGARNTGVTGENGDVAMYVANGPMTSVGELGYLLYDATKPWTTINLYNTTGAVHDAEVFDRFVIDQKVKAGAINPGSRYAPVIACAFDGDYVNTYPNDVGGTLIDHVAAANAVVAARPPAGYNNLSDVIRLAGAGLLSSQPSATTTTLKESILRNGLANFSTRQNSFAVIVYGQVVAEDGAGGYTPLADQVAVAYIWRDPYKSPTTGAFPHLIRFLRWTDDFP